MDERKSSLTAALVREFEMEEGGAEELAEEVLAWFADEAEVNDELLDAELRSVFYTLEGKKILTFRRAEGPNEQGEHRRSFFWRLRPESLGFQPANPPPSDPVTEVYTKLPREAWRHRAT